jgi:formate-dependent nitrite reductase membrane component NrfD
VTVSAKNFRVLLSATLLQVELSCPITFWDLAAEYFASGRSFLHYKLKNAINFQIDAG